MPRWLVPALVVVSLAGMASALAPACGLTTSPADLRFAAPTSIGLTVGPGTSGSYTLYAVSDLCQPQCIASAWIYQEMNGFDGLQRHDVVRDDTCGGAYVGDLLLW